MLSENEGIFENEEKMVKVKTEEISWHRWRKQTGGGRRENTVISGAIENVAEISKSLEEMKSVKKKIIEEGEEENQRSAACSWKINAASWRCESCNEKANTSKKWNIQ